MEEAAIPLKVDADNSLSDHPALKLMSGILSLRQGDYAVATEYLFMQAVEAPVAFCCHVEGVSVPVVWV